MPIYMRNYYLQKLIEVKKKEEEAIEKTKKNKSGISRPSFPSNTSRKPYKG